MRAATRGDIPEELPFLSDALLSYIVVYSGISLDVAVTLIKKSMTRTTELRDLFSQRSHPKPLFTMARPDFSSSKPIFNWIYKKMEKLQRRYDRVALDFFQPFCKDMDVVYDFLCKCLQMGFAASLRADLFVRDKTGEFDKREDVRAIVFRIQALDKFVSGTRVAKFLNVDDNLLAQAMKYLEKHCERGTDFSPDFVFEEIFRDYVRSSEHGSKLRAVAQTIMSEPLNMSEVIPYVKTFVPILKPATMEQFHIVENAVMRELFDEIYVTKPVFWASDSDVVGFIENCKKFLKETPKSLGIAQGILRPELYEVPMEDVVKDGPEFEKAADLLECLAFLNSPIDILEYITRAMKMVEVYVLLYVAPENEKKNVKTDLASMMCWDDWFGMFCSTLAMKPSVTAVATKEFLQLIKGMKMSVAVEYTYNLYIGAVDYLCTYKPG